MPFNRSYFTKTLFSVALECPTKLYYHNKLEYPSTKEDNEFLSALAQGGFQVGALARCYYPDGCHVKTLDHKASLKQTNELLKTVSKLLGHKTIQATQIYAKIVDEKKKAAMELLPTIEWENNSAENALKIEKKVRESSLPFNCNKRSVVG